MKLFLLFLFFMYKGYAESIRIVIDRNPNIQEMTVFFNNETDPRHVFKISTGRETLDFPTNYERNPYCSFTEKGIFQIEKLRELNSSKTWLKKNSDNSYTEGVSMPFSIFFNKGIAIHGVSKENEKKLGKNVSGGCVRLSNKNAKILFDYLVEKDGKNYKKKDPNSFDSNCKGDNPPDYCHNKKMWPVSKNKEISVSIEVIDSRKEEDQLIIYQKCMKELNKFYEERKKCLINLNDNSYQSKIECNKKISLDKNHEFNPP